MTGDILPTCIAQCDTTRIAWEYIIEHQSWIAWIIGGVFTTGMFVGWLVTTIRNMQKQFDQRAIPQQPIEYKGSDTPKLKPSQFKSSDASSSEEITKLPI